MSGAARQKQLEAGFHHLPAYRLPAFTVPHFSWLVPVWQRDTHGRPVLSSLRKGFLNLRCVVDNG